MGWITKKLIVFKSMLVNNAAASQILCNRKRILVNYHAFQRGICSSIPGVLKLCTFVVRCDVLRPFDDLVCTAFTDMQICPGMNGNSLG